MDLGEGRGRQNEQIDEEETQLMLGKMIKHSKTLQHLNLTGTGLNSAVIFEMGSFMRRARSLLVIHLSANPGIYGKPPEEAGLDPELDNMNYLSRRIKCRLNEDIERFTRVSAFVKGVMTAAGAGQNIIDGIKIKVDRDNDFSQVHMKDPLQFSPNE